VVKDGSSLVRRGWNQAQQPLVSLQAVAMKSPIPACRMHSSQPGLRAKSPPVTVLNIAVD
jgi:hypothetical protein